MRVSRRGCPALVALLVCAVWAACHHQVRAQPDGFVEEVVVSGFDEPVGLAFGPGDLLYVWEKGGRVRIVEDDAILAQPLMDLTAEVNEYWTRGLTGFALDPDFDTNGFVYLMYTVEWEWYVTDGNPVGPLDTNHDTFGRLVRYTLDPATDYKTVVPGSRWVMIGDDHANGFAVTFASHTQNTIVFAPDGTMLLSAGDGASMLAVDIGGFRNPCCSSNTAEADGILPLKEQIGAFRAQLVDSHGGKILRIDPATAEGVPSNPFYDAAACSAPRSRVWSLGLRNPYTFAVRPGTGSADPADGDPGVLVIGDVGWDTWERLCVATGPGRNFGWPVYEGLSSASAYPSTQVENLDAPNPLFGLGGCTQAFFDFTDLLVQDTLNAPSWPNPCDAAEQIPADLTFMHTRAALAWRNSRVFFTPLSVVPAYDGDGEALVLSISHPESPVSGPHLRGVATIGGDFYTGDVFPAAYHGSYFFGEAGNDSGQLGWIQRAVFDDDHELVSVETFRQTGSLFPTNVTFDPDGTGLYYANHLPGTSGQIRRIVLDLAGDVNGDGAVNVADLVSVILAWGPCGLPCPEDVDGDATVDVGDLIIVILNWT